MKSLTEIFSGPPRPTLPPEERTGYEGLSVCERCVALCSEIVTEKRRGRI